MKAWGAVLVRIQWCSFHSVLSRFGNGVSSVPPCKANLLPAGNTFWGHGPEPMHRSPSPSPRNILTTITHSDLVQEHMECCHLPYPCAPDHPLQHLQRKFADRGGISPPLYRMVPTQCPEYVTDLFVWILLLPQHPRET